MAHISEPRIGEAATTAGTGPFTLTGALTAHARVSSVCSVGDTFWGDIEAVDGNGRPSGNWVEGLFTYSAANQVTVTTVYRSSNANAAVTFADGTKYVRLIADARQIAAVPRGGSAGQVLSKNGASDYDTTWLDADSRYAFKTAYVTAADATTITPALITNDTTRTKQVNTQAAGTLTLANPTGTPSDGEILLVRVTCTNAQTLAFGTSYAGTTQLSLPASTTGSSKTDRMLFEYRTAALAWQLIGISFGA